MSKHNKKCKKCENKKISREKEAELADWIEEQRILYRNKEGIMKNEEIYNKWRNFIHDERYKKFFMEDQDI